MLTRCWGGKGYTAMFFLQRVPCAQRHWASPLSHRGQRSWALAEADVPSGPALAPTLGSLLVWLLWGQWARRFQDGLRVSAADTGQ